MHPTSFPDSITDSNIKNVEVLLSAFFKLAARIILPVTHIKGNCVIMERLSLSIRAICYITKLTNLEDQCQIYCSKVVNEFINLVNSSN